MWWKWHTKEWKIIRIFFFNPFLHLQKRRTTLQNPWKLRALKATDNHTRSATSQFSKNWTWGEEGVTTSTIKKELICFFPKKILIFPYDDEVIWSSIICNWVDFSGKHLTNAEVWTHARLPCQCRGLNSCMTTWPMLRFELMHDHLTNVPRLIKATQPKSEGALSNWEALKKKLSWSISCFWKFGHWH